MVCKVHDTGVICLRGNSFFLWTELRDGSSDSSVFSCFLLLCFMRRCLLLLVPI